LHLRADLAPLRIVLGARVRPHVVHGLPVDVEWLAGRARLGRVSGRVAPADVDLVEAEVVRDLFALGMEHVAVAVPPLLMLQALALLDDLAERGERGCEVMNGDDAPAAAVVQLVRDLPGWIAAE